MFCSNCKKPCKGTNVDFGYGVTEFWGSVSNDVNIQYVSQCCEDEMFYDKDLTDPVDQEYGAAA